MGATSEDLIMAFVPDFSLPGNEVLLDMINQENSKTYTLSEIYFEVPEENNVVGEPNTAVIVRTVPGGGYKGSVEIKYNRLDLDTIFTGSLTLQMDSTAVLADILAQVNSEYGLGLTTSDVELDDQGIAARSLVALSTSYTLIGQVLISFQGAPANSLPENALLGFDGDPILGFDGDFIVAFA